MIGDFDFSEPKGKPLDTSIPAVRIATGTDVRHVNGTEPKADEKTPERVKRLPPATEPMTHRAWCGLCGTYVYDKARLPCVDKPNFSWDTCGLNGQSTEQVPMSYRKDHEEQKKVDTMIKHQWQHHQDSLKVDVIPLSAEGVKDLLQRNHGDETSCDDTPFEAHAEAINERLEDECSETSPTSVKRSLVEEAMSITSGARRKAYGTPEDNFRRIALLWAAYDEAQYGHDVPGTTAHDIAMKMILMKVARIIETPDHRDSYTDVIGYILCGAEIAGVK